MSESLNGKKSPDLCYIRVISAYKKWSGVGRHTARQELGAHHRQRKAQAWALLAQPVTGGMQGDITDQGHSFFTPVPKVCRLFKVKKLFILALDNWPGRKIGIALKNDSCGDEAAKIKICLGKAENIFLKIGLSNSN